MILSSPPTVQSELEYRDWLFRHHERYLLVENTFTVGTGGRVGTRGLVKEIWKSICRLDEDSDEVLAADISAKLGAAVTASQLPGPRRRLRQRLEVFHYLYDLLDGGMPDTPGDAALVAWIAARWGIAEKDLPTLRCLGALARAAKDENTLGWALLSRLYSRGRVVDLDSYSAALALIERAGPGKESDFRHRLSRWHRWREDRDRNGIMARLFRESRDSGMLFLLPACWYLSVLQEKNEESIVQRLGPGNQAEREWIGTLVRGFE